MPLGKRADFGDARYAGAETVFTCDIVPALQVTRLHEDHQKTSNHDHVNPT